MAEIQLKRTNKEYADVSSTIDGVVGEQTLECGEPIILDYSASSTGVDTPIYMGIGKTNSTDDALTKVKDAPVFKAFKNKEKADSIVFRDGEQLITEGGVEIGTSKINAEEITDFATLQTLPTLYLTLVDEEGKAYRVNIADLGLTIDPATGVFSTPGWK